MTLKHHPIPLTIYGQSSKRKIICKSALRDRQPSRWWQIRWLFLSLTLVFASCNQGSCDPTGGSGTPQPAEPNGQAVLGWGGNSSGQIGDGTNFQRITPSLVDLRNIRSIAAGGNYSLAVTVDGRVLEWGGGQKIPTEVPGLTSIKAVAAGFHHRLAVTNSGNVLAWGENNRGQLGDGTNSPRPTPVQVTGLTNVAAVAVGGDHSVAIRTDFSVWSWGANDTGQLGDGTKTDKRTPVVVPGIKAIEVAASATHTIALTTNVEVMGWGSNSACQLDFDPRSNPFAPFNCSDRLVPTKLSLPQPSSKGGKIAATASMSLVVLPNGMVYGLGGKGDPIPGEFRGMCEQGLAFGAAPIFGPHDVEEVVAGTTHVLFRTVTGEVWILGGNAAGQGGLGTTTVQECAHVVPSTLVRGVSQIAAGDEHSLALIKGSLSFNPVAIDFGNQPFGMGNGPMMNVTIANSGLAPVTFSDISIVGAGDYSFTEDCPDKPNVLMPNAICTTKIAFAPTAPGRRDGIIALVYDGLEARHEIALTGIGTEANPIMSPTNFQFGPQPVGTVSAPLQVTIENQGPAPLLIKDISVTAGFSVSSGNCPRTPNAVPAQGKCTVDVAFKPNAAGVAIGELELTYEPGNKAVKITLRGTGT